MVKARRAPRPKAPIEAEETPPPYWQALLTPIVAHSFDEIGISVSLWSSGDWWESIHRIPNVTSFESEHGVARRRQQSPHRPISRQPELIRVEKQDPVCPRLARQCRFVATPGLQVEVPGFVEVTHADAP